MILIWMPMISWGTEYCQVKKNDNWTLQVRLTEDLASATEIDTLYLAVKTDQETSKIATSSEFYFDGKKIHGGRIITSSVQGRFVTVRVYFVKSDPLVKSEEYDEEFTFPINAVRGSLEYLPGNSIYYEIKPKDKPAD